ncbi:uncharacterized protein TRUGW13939_10950 [Talaromyces rugulosus]|uniref:Uncharacterized protein n=1 Tax=Talaromyces rugulosus TaxID=121627 RepID=A0A7H8RBD9_TALRU|nr:uncharacterized protein TRUGW13939_10950 [Talaromyces rugulosus]QKX63779.1 hypothetical protein TRUGW13939_10950 [Talaromyces rugulosus]
MNTGDASWLLGLGINQVDQDGDVPITNGINSEGPVTDAFPTINVQTAFANEYNQQAPPPPPPQPSFLRTPPELSQQHHQQETLENRIERLFRESERSQNENDQRLQISLEVLDGRRSAEIRFLNNKLRTIENEVREIDVGIFNLKRRVENMENTAENIQADTRDAKRQATDEHNIVRGVLQNFTRQASDRHRAMDQRLTDIEGSSQKMERKVAKFGKAVKNAAYELHKLSEIVEKNGSARKRRCRSPNYVCVHRHTVGSSAAHPNHLRDHDNEDGQSQNTDTSSSNHARAEPSCPEKTTRPLNTKNKRRTRSGN